MSIRDLAKLNKELYPHGTRIMLLQMGIDKRPVSDNTHGDVNA